MPAPPTTKEITDSVVAEIESKINQTIPLLPKAFIRVIAKVFAGIIIVLYYYSGFIFLQIFVATASFKDTNVNGQVINPLKFWGRLTGLGDPDPGEAAELLIDINVIQQGGTLYAGETNVLGSLNGVTYSLLTDVSLNAEVVQGDFKAVSDPDGQGGIGSVGNLTTGDTVSFATPYGDVEPDAVVDSRTVDGADAETKESYQDRITGWFGGRPQGGAGLDYVYWAKEVPGINNVYPYTGDPGEVDVYNEATPESSGSPDGIPTPAQLTAVQEAIEKNEAGLALNRPLNSFINVYAITRTAFTVDVIDLTGENIDTLKTLISDALTTFLLQREPFIDGVTPLPRKRDITQEDIRSIVNDYAVAANGSFSTAIVKFTLSGVPFQVYTLTPGEKAKLTIVNYLTT